jgi:hypothetical protein
MSIDLSSAGAYADLTQQLNAPTSALLLWWSQADLYRWFDEAAQRLARKCGIWVARDTSITAANGTLSYALPSEQVSTIQVDLGGTVLAPRTTAELEALDATWPTTVETSANPTNCFIQDTQGLNQIGLYPTPQTGISAGKTLGMVIHETIPTVTSSNTTVGAPNCLREYFTFMAIGEARAAETKAAMQEVADWMRQLTAWMEQIIEGYWGEAQ